MATTPANPSDHRDPGEPSESPALDTAPTSESRPKQDTEASPRFTFKDVITIILSLAALMVSVSSFYLSNLRVDDNLQLRVAAIDTLFHMGEPTLVAHTAFVNAGNRPALVMGVEYKLGPPSMQWGWGNRVESDVPVVIPPHEIRLIDVLIPLGSLVQNAAKGTPVTDPSDPGPVFAYYCALGVTSLDSRGVRHQKQTVPFVEVHVTSQREVGTKTVNANGPGGVNGLVTYLFK